MATKKAATKTQKSKKTVSRKTTSQKVDKKHVASAYYWGGIAIAFCAAFAFMLLAFGVGLMIR